MSAWRTPGHCPLRLYLRDNLFWQFCDAHSIPFSLILKKDNSQEGLGRNRKVNVVVPQSHIHWLLRKQLVPLQLSPLFAYSSFQVFNGVFIDIIHYYSSFWCILNHQNLTIILSLVFFKLLYSWDGNFMMVLCSIFISLMFTSFNRYKDDKCWVIWTKLGNDINVTSTWQKKIVVAR